MTESAGEKGRMDRSISSAISSFAVNARSRALPADARRVLKLSLLDCCAVAIAGADEPVSRIARRLVEEEGGTPVATIVGSGARAPARAAALANGAISHALDYDDTHFDYIGHPSVAVFPAAFALAEKTRASGRDFLDAALVGMETACRVGAWLGPRHYQHGFHQTATSGAFGATAAAIALTGLDVERARHAFGIAATRASGLKSQFGTMGKPYNAGIAASNGVEAATLAGLGFVSRPDGLECEQGFSDTHAGEARHIDVVLAGLGDVFRFERVQHKFHACCHGTHAALEALMALREEQKIKSGDVARVTLTVHPHWLRVCHILSPVTGLEAKFSYRLTAAMALAGGDTGALHSFTDEACMDAELVGLRDRVEVVGDPLLNDTSARARVELADGRAFETHHDLDRPLPLETRIARVRRKAATLLGSGKSDKLWTIINDLDGETPDRFAAILAEPR